VHRERAVRAHWALGILPLEKSMPAAPRPSFLRRLRRGTAARRGPDLADMGTAFALDEALELGAWNAPQPGDAKRPARGARPMARWRLWLGRRRVR